MCVCVCVCVEREREREREKHTEKTQNLHEHSLARPKSPNKVGCSVPKKLTPKMAYMAITSNATNIALKTGIIANVRAFTIFLARTKVVSGTHARTHTLS